MKNILVTGGAGFIGSNLIDRLLKDGNKVIVIDDFSRGKEENIIHHKDNLNLKIYKKSICDKDILDLFKDVEIVYHLAALPRVQYSIQFPEQTNEVNINGTLNLLEICRKIGIKRFVYSSSSSAYGEQDTLPLVENMHPKPISPYALQKLVCEHYCNLYYLLYGIETISLRYFNVYGPRHDPYEGYANLIPKAINLILNGKSPEIYGDGNQTRDFTFVNDVIEANILAGTTSNKEAFGQVFNIGYGRNISVNELINLIIGDKNIKPIYSPPVIEPRDTLADISKAKKLLNWKPKIPIEEGIKETIKFFSK